MVEQWIKRLVFIFLNVLTIFNHFYLTKQSSCKNLKIINPLSFANNQIQSFLNFGEPLKLRGKTPRSFINEIVQQKCGTPIDDFGRANSTSGKTNTYQ